VFDESRLESTVLQHGSTVTVSCKNTHPMSRRYMGRGKQGRSKERARKEQGESKG
jgi:hypothetical protein